MSNKRWLKQETPLWVKEEIITKENAEKLIARYGKKDFSGYREVFFILALSSFVGGFFFLGAGIWQSLSQDERFVLALAPLLITFLLLVGVILGDKVVSNKPSKKESPSLSLPLEDVSDSETGSDSAKKLGRKSYLWGILMGETKDVPPTEKRHLIPTFVRESAAVLHGLSVLSAFWMVSDSFMLSSDTYVGLTYIAFLLLLLTYLSGTAGLGILTMVSAVGIFYTSPVSGWPVFVSWFLMVLVLPMLWKLLYEHRDRAVICFSWVWAVGILLLIFWSAGALLWQTMFFSLTASLTWMAGGAFRSYGLGAEALRFFGGIAVFAVLLEGAYGSVWAHISGSYALWTLFLLFLVADAVLLFRMALKKEWLSFLAGFTPFVMAAAAILALLDPSGASSAILISVYTAILSSGVVLRGIQTGRNAQCLAGEALLIGAGIIRVIDSSLSLTQRGGFFLAIGVLSAILCIIFFKPKKKIKRKEIQKEIPVEPKEDNK